MIKLEPSIITREPTWLIIGLDWIVLKKKITNFSMG